MQAFLSPSVSAVDSQWAMQITASGQFSAPSALNWQAALTAQPPCTAASVYRAANQTLPEPLDQHDVWFQTSLTLPEDLAFLHFDGLAGPAQIFWNDVQIGQSENMFMRCSLPDSLFGAQRSGTLTLYFPALNTVLAQRRPRPRWKTRLVEQQQLRWLRTSLLGRMPGWSPTGAPVGPYRPVWFERRQTWRISQLRLQPELHGNDGYVRFHADIQQTHKLKRALLHVGPHSAELSILPQDAQCSELQGELFFPEPQRWWPHTHGTPHLYTCLLELEGEDQHLMLPLGETGFRSLHADQQDGGYTVYVNDVAVFCRGACWTPADVTRLYAEPESLRQHLQLARDAGMNMLRLPGTMQFEQDDFYQLCSEMGIMVWQDMMFANMDYPVGDAAFADLVAAESAAFLQRTQSAVCLAVICGNSEVEQQAAMLGQPAENWRNPFFGDTLPALCKQWRPDLLYIPSSPSGGVMPFQVDAGIAHYFGVGAYLRTPDDARLSGVRFTSECLGFANMPEDSLLDRMHGNGDSPGAHPSWKQGVPRDHGTGWDFEDVRDHYLTQMYQTDAMRLRYADRERYLALTRRVTGQLMEQTLQTWRRAGSACHGALIWFWKDLREGAGWGVVDAHGQAKAAYYYLKRSMAAQTAFLTDEGLNGLACHVVNDSAQTMRGTLTLRLLRLPSSTTAEVSLPLELAPHSQWQQRADALLPYFMDTTYAYRFGPVSHQVAAVHWQVEDDAAGSIAGYAFPAGHVLPAESQASVTLQLVDQTAQQIQIRLCSDRFLQAVHLQANGVQCSDNYFHLYPGVPHTLQVSGAAANTRLQLSALNLNGVLKLAFPAEAVTS